MSNYNKVILVGNLTRDPQTSYLPSQTPACEIGLAVNRKWQGTDGQKKEEACFIDCRAYGKQAETIQQYMTKGKPILVEGRLQLDTWEGKDGQKRSKHRVIVERFQFLGGAGEQQATPRPVAQQPAPPAHNPNDLLDQADAMGGDDIPF